MMDELRQLRQAAQEFFRYEHRLFRDKRPMSQTDFDATVELYETARRTLIVLSGVDLNE
jgi:hypothetical protein